MTREEMINVLKMVRDLTNSDSDTGEEALTNEFDDILVEALDMAIDALEEQRWTPVNKGLPDAYEDVFVTDFGGGMATVHEDSCGIYEDTGEKFWFSSQNVTAWMPLPKPFMEE